MGTSAPPADPYNDEGIQPHRLVEQQAALRRVAMLVARGATAGDVFDAVAKEVAQVLRLTNAAVCRYDQDGSTMTVLAVHGPRPDTFEPGSRWPLDGPSMSAEVLRTGRPARIEEYAELSGSLAAAAREHGFNRLAGAPVFVAGRVWGVVSTSSPDAPLPDHVEDRLAEFTELVATAIANSQARDELTLLAEEQAALRRVATLVAAGAPPAEVFEAVSAEVAALITADGSALTRYEEDGTVTAVSSWTPEGGYSNLGSHYVRQGTVSGLIFETGRPGRIDNYAEAPGMGPRIARERGIRSAAGAPVTVEGRLWGALIVVSNSERPLPGDTEERLVEFAALFATAIANSETHEQLARVAKEQAALRRVATLVAAGAAPAEVFEAVSAEVAALIAADGSALTRYEADGTITAVSGWTTEGGFTNLGARYALEGSLSGVILEAGRPARLDNYAHAPGEAQEAARGMGFRSAVGAPITVDGRFWGVLSAGSKSERPLPRDTERRLAEFAELFATAIANAEGRAELDASRARIVATADATRCRIERDLHDGAQQQLVGLALALRAAQATVPEELEQHRSELGRVVDGLTTALDDLREIALGIHPAGLSEDGLTPALKRLVARSPLRVNLDVRAEGRFPEPVEVTAYYVVSESLTNAAKYAETPTVDVAVAAGGGVLRVEVRDLGRGGADPAEGSGLLGLRDRVEAIGGAMQLASPPGAGTSLRVELPLVDRTARHLKAAAESSA